MQIGSHIPRGRKHRSSVAAVEESQAVASVIHGHDLIPLTCDNVVAAEARFLAMATVAFIVILSTCWPVLHSVQQPLTAVAWECWPLAMQPVQGM